MRTVICDDDAFVRFVGNGELYDYELGERYYVAPAARGDHASIQTRVLVALSGAFEPGTVLGPCNLGVLGEQGRRWYVVPDAVVLPVGEPADQEAFGAVRIAVEIRSPRESAAMKLAAYREVADRAGLTVDEVWYVDGAQVSVHPAASEATGSTRYPEALQAVQAVVAG